MTIIIDVESSNIEMNDEMLQLSDFNACIVPLSCKVGEKS